MKLSLIAFAVCALVTPSFSAITSTSYPFSSAAGVALESMSSGTTQLIGSGSDDGVSAVTNIGFDFVYDGVVVTQFSVNANGLVRLGAAAVLNTFNNADVSNGFNAVGNAPKLTAYWDDLCTGSNGKVHYKLIGSAPNRKLVIEWQNMQITRAAGCSGAGNGTFQVWLSEGSGAIEFVYGNLQTPAAADGGHSIGLQSRAATNLASVTSATNTVSYASANNTQSDAIGAGTKFTFTPNVPAAPSGLNFTNVTAISMTLNWTDSASNEVAYLIYQSTDGVNFTLVAQTAANAVSQNFSGLTASTNYFWRVFAISEGAFSATLAGNQSTAAPGSIISTSAGGNWSSGATWIGGIVPAATDDVTIADGATVTIDTAAVAYNLNVGQGASGVLRFEAMTARTLTTGASVTISANGSFVTQPSGTVTAHALSIAGNLTNNGVLDFSTNANTAGAGITFTGPTNASFSGTGLTTDLRALTINKGTSPASVLDLSVSNFSVQGSASDLAGFLSLTNGTVKISGTFAMSNRVFTAAAYTIPATAGFWLNNPNFVVAGQSGSPTNNGLLRISQGTCTVGTSGINVMGGGLGAAFIIEGGTMNFAGRLFASNAVTYTQSSGTVNVCTAGGCSSPTSFGLTSTSSAFNMSGGAINLINASSNASPIDYQVLAMPTISGGTLTVGSPSTASNFTFRLAGNVPSLVINNTTNVKTATAAGQLTIYGNVTINPGTTLALNGFFVNATGANFTNNGTVTGNVTNSRLYFGSTSAAQVYAGSGAAGFAALPLFSLEFDSPGGVSFDPAVNNVLTNRVVLFTGSVTNANKITLGSGGFSPAVVQIGNSGAPTNAGIFDVSPTYNLGGAGEALVYAHTTTPRSTGFEVNPTRALVSLTVNSDLNPVTIAGGDLTLSSTGTAATLMSGRLVTGANNLILSSSTATITRTSGYVHGNLRKTYSAAATKTFEVGDATTYAPATIFAGGGSFPSNVTVSTVGAQEPHYPGVLSALRRYWTIDTSTNLIADLTFQYAATDILGIEPAYHTVVYQMIDLTTSIFIDLGTVDAVNHRGTANGINNIRGNWTLLEADTDFDGMPNSYENAQGFDPNIPDDASTDSDADGASNFSEYLAGTDPKLASSLLRVTATTRDLAGHAIVSFNAIANKTYRLEFNTTPGGAGWMMLPITDLTAPATGTQQLNDTTAAGTNRFYRVRVIFP